MSKLMPRYVRRLARRPAPPGTREPDRSGSTDGWRNVEQRRMTRIADRADAALIRTSDFAVATITRRRLLRRAGELGLIGAGLATLAKPSLARAAPWQNDPSVSCGYFGGGGGGCGTSGLCGVNVCNVESNCKLDHASGPRRRGPWPGLSCIGDQQANCWTECCGGQRKRCCDCCVGPQYAPGSLNCTGCANPNLRRCICRAQVANC